MTSVKSWYRDVIILHAGETDIFFLSRFGIRYYYLYSLLFQLKGVNIISICFHNGVSPNFSLFIPAIFPVLQSCTELL